MRYNLTDRAKKLLRDLVGLVRAGKLKDDYFLVSSRPDYERNGGYINYINLKDKGLLPFKFDHLSDLHDLCETDPQLVGRHKSNDKLYKIKQAGFDAVDNNFFEGSDNVILELKNVWQRLESNLNTLKEQEAKLGSELRIDLRNEIEDHDQAIELIKQAIGANSKLLEEIKPLNISADLRSRINSILGQEE